MRLKVAAIRFDAVRLTAAICALGFATAAVGQAQLSHFPDPIFHDGYNGLNAVGTANISAGGCLALPRPGHVRTDRRRHRKSAFDRLSGLARRNSSRRRPRTRSRICPGKTNSAYLNWVANVLKEQVGQDNRQEAWFLGALGGKDPQFPNNSAYNHADQLRQRVAFALSEILVVSDQNPLLDGFPQGLAWYYDILIRDAFGNYRQLLQDVTLSPAMGVYLNMMGNQRANSAMNFHPDENYGREINQLVQHRSRHAQSRRHGAARRQRQADSHLRAEHDHQLRPRLYRLYLVRLRREHQSGRFS